MRIAVVAQTRSNHGCYCTGETPFSQMAAQDFYLIYLGIIHLGAQITADHSNFGRNFALNSLRNLSYF